MQFMTSDERENMESLNRAVHKSCSGQVQLGSEAGPLAQLYLGWPFKSVLCQNNMYMP